MCTVAGAIATMGQTANIHYRNPPIGFRIRMFNDLFGQNNENLGGGSDVTFKRRKQTVFDVSESMPSLTVVTVRL